MRKESVSTGATGRPLAPQAARSVAPLVDSTRALPLTSERPIQAMPTLATRRKLQGTPTQIYRTTNGGTARKNID